MTALCHGPEKFVFAQNVRGKKKHDLAPKVVQQNVDHHFGLSFETHVVFCDISKYYKIEIT